MHLFLTQESNPTIRKGDGLDIPMGCVLRATIAAGAGSGAVGGWIRGRWCSWWAPIFSAVDVVDVSQGF